MSTFLNCRLLLCVGPGGVGKTSCAAALALAEANRGRRVAVLTVDPSHRLAQALSITQSTDSEDFRPGALVPVQDGLDAMLLDAPSVFEAIVRECCSLEDAQRILKNRFYQAMARQLGGALEYAAMAQVQMLEAQQHEGQPKYDLIVLDTPPTANAIELFQAPERVRELLENPAAKLLLGTGRLGGRLLSWGGKTAIAKVFEQLAGGALLFELGEFLREFSGVMETFHKKGRAFANLLQDPTTAAVLVTSPAPFSIREAEGFLVDLKKLGIRLDRVVLNQAEPAFPEKSAELETDDPQLNAALRGAKARAQQVSQAKQHLESIKGGPVVRVLGRQAQGPQTLEDLLELGQRIA